MTREQRRAITLVWAALMMAVVMTTVVAAVIGPSMRTPPLPVELSYAMFALALVNAVLSRVLSRVLPAVMKGPEATKAVASFALCEGAALANAIAWMLTGQLLSVLGIVIGFGALASLFPREKKPGDETVKLMP